MDVWLSYYSCISCVSLLPRGATPPRQLVPGECERVKPISVIARVGQCCAMVRTVHSPVTQ